MAIKTIVEKIFEMEEELHLFSKQIDGVKFWELMRFNVFTELSQQTKIHGKAQYKVDYNFRNMAKYTSKFIKNSFYHNPFFLNQSDILFFGTSRLKLMDDGTWWDIYCDPIIEEIEKNYKCVIIQFPNKVDHRGFRKFNNVKYLDFIMATQVLGKKFRYPLVNLSAADNESIDPIEDYIYRTLKVRLGLKNMILEKLQNRKISIQVYNYILKRVRPKLAIVVCSYGKEAFVEICKRMKVPVAELQHGSISRYHVGYSYIGGRAVKENFPDYFFAFGDFWKSTVSFPIPKKNIFSVGYPYFEMETAKYKNEDKKNQIIFISQGTIGESMSKFAVDLQNREDFPLDIVYKLHPGEYSRWKKMYPWLVNSRIQVIDDDAIPLYKLFAQSKALVGVYSTAVYEGFTFGLKTFLLKLPGIEFMKDLVESNLVQVIDSVDQIISSVTSLNDKLENQDYFFKRASVNNLSKAIDYIVSKSDNGIVAK